MQEQEQNSHNFRADVGRENKGSNHPRTISSPRDRPMVENTASLHSSEIRIKDTPLTPSDVETLSHLVLRSKRIKILLGHKQYSPITDFGLVRGIYEQLEERHDIDEPLLPNLRDDIRYIRQTEALKKLDSQLVRWGNSRIHTVEDEAHEFSSWASEINNSMAGYLVPYLEWAAAIESGGLEKSPTEMHWQAPVEMITALQKRELEKHFASHPTKKMSSQQKDTYSEENETDRKSSKILAFKHAEVEKKKQAVRAKLQESLELITNNPIFPATMSELSEKLDIPTRVIQKIVNALNLQPDRVGNVAVFREPDALLITSYQNISFTRNNFEMDEIVEMKTLAKEIYTASQPPAAHDSSYDV